MYKYSIIVPVYNVEEYLKRCLDSLVEQTFQNFEVIIVCDRCSDRSEEIVDEYTGKHNNFKKIFAVDTGLAKARNIGIKHVSGEFIIFLDGDDFLEKDLLEVLNREFCECLDVLRFQVRNVSDRGNIDYVEDGFDELCGRDAFKILLKYHYVENSWAYVYKTSFWKENDFRFMENCIAEDYGLTPLIIAKAKKVKSIPYIGYNYVQRNNSLMNNSDYTKRIKKMEDMLIQANNLKSKLSSLPNVDDFVTFINNSLIFFSTTLNRKDYLKYKKVLKNGDCFNHLVKGKNLRQSIKFAMIKFSPWFFYHYFVR